MIAGGEVGDHGSERDDFNTIADLEAAGGGVEGDHPGDERVSVHGLTNPSTGPGGAWVRYFSAISETPHSAPAAAPRSRPSPRCGRWRRVEILKSAATTAKIAPPMAISAASEARCVSSAPLVEIR